VTGPLCARQLVMIRADAEVQAEPDPLFAFFTSVAGYKVIDPACNNHDDKPLRQWSERCACGQRPAPAPPRELAIAWGIPARSQRCTRLCPIQYLLVPR